MFIAEKVARLYEMTMNFVQSLSKALLGRFHPDLPNLEIKKNSGMLAYIIISSVIVFVLYAIYAQIELSRLIDFIRQSPAMTQIIGDVSDLYYIVTMTRGNYGFVLYLWRNPVPDAEINAKFADYNKLRSISNIALLLHMALGVLIILSVFKNLIFKI